MSLWSAFSGSDANALQVLGEIDLFDDLTPRELGLLHRSLHRRTYMAGEAVFEQGEPGLGMYVIAEGTVSIQSEPSGRVLTELGRGAVFGEIALFNAMIRTATARAKTDCVLLALFQPGLAALLDRRPRLGVKLLLALASEAGLRIVELSQELAGARRDIRRLKGSLGEQTATPTPEATTPDAPVPRHDDG